MMNTRPDKVVGGGGLPLHKARQPALAVLEAMSVQENLCLLLPERGKNLVYWFAETTTSRQRGKSNARARNHPEVRKMHHARVQERVGPSKGNGAKCQLLKRFALNLRFRQTWKA